MSKTSSNTISTNNTSLTILSNSSNEQQSTIISSSIASNSKSDDEQKQHKINLIDEWCEKMKEENNKQDFHLKESIDYEIIANYMLNKASIKCQCGITATLEIKIIFAVGERIPNPMKLPGVQNPPFPHWWLDSD
ncbi:unnamed protein product [Rotaria socialis]|uniref:Uncharacterized protein n=1 Tax=Rotaria socialis TaxID=392032 RepID=A0A821J357_9BILA|nr:unnamed protein product [Rotaria socialis]CAF4555051.1 unnamed protein product [Rotaria socialis]CAF4712239.1 unnamed protein product [Rotaria socialis]